VNPCNDASASPLNAWRSPPLPARADGDTDGQVKAIEAPVARGDKGILITPNGPGVNSAIENARSGGLYVIALDTPPDPADTIDITFATDNFEAGELIGKWTAAHLDGKQADIALLDLFNDRVVSVDYDRGRGFLTGMGIPTGDDKKVDGLDGISVTEGQDLCWG
jgi:ABC-type sugar transport system substrate-binding protein